MEFKKEDENYVYNTIGKNVKKYRKLKGLTQVQLAEKIDYSVSFVSGLESKTHQSFSLGALWRIAMILDVDMYKLCIDEDNIKEDDFDKMNYTKFKCDKCDFVTYIPNSILDSYFNLAKEFNNEKFKNKYDIKFACAKCSGQIEITKK